MGMDLTERNYEEIDKIIRSAVDRTVHSDILKNEIIAIIAEVVPKSIQTTVNGKIDKVHAILERQNEVMDSTTKKIDGHISQHEEDMKELKPWMQGAAGIRLIWKFAITIAVGWVAIKSGIVQIMK